MIGVGYRRELAGWIKSRPADVECLEITAEHFFDDGEPQLRELQNNFRLFVHGLSLSLGTPGALDEERLAKFARVVAAAQPDWISEHVAFTRTSEIDLGHLNPVPLTRESLGIMAEHTRALAARCARPVLLENITSHLRLPGELTEPEFLNELCAQAHCGLLLDVTNLFINSRNHGFDPLTWLAEIEPSRIRQLHIVGYSIENGRFVDNHAQPIQPELLELARAVIERAPVEAIILERDANFPEAGAMSDEVAKLRSLLERD